MAFDTPAAVAGILFTVAFTQVGIDLVDAMSDGIWQLTRPKAINAVDGLLLTVGEADAGVVPHAAVAADRHAGAVDAVDRAVRPRGADLPRGRAGADGVGDECVAGDRVGAPPRRSSCSPRWCSPSWRSRWRSPSGSARWAGSARPAIRASRRSRNGLAEFGDAGGGDHHVRAGGVHAVPGDQADPDRRGRRDRPGHPVRPAPSGPDRVAVLRTTSRACTPVWPARAGRRRCRHWPRRHERVGRRRRTRRRDRSATGR